MEEGDDAWRGAETLDLTGLKCPLPALLTEKALRGLTDGAHLAVTVTDPMAPLDLRHVCQRGGHTLVAEIEVPGGSKLLIRRLKRT